MNIPYAFKKCSKCGKWLVANTYNFGKGKNYKWGLRRQCKKCEKQWREENKEHKKEYNKKYGKQWREENKEYKKEYDKKEREEKPEKCFNNQNKRRSKEKNQGRGMNKEQWLEMMNFFDWKCSYSGEKMKKGDKSTYGRTIDHIVAIDNGGLNEPWNVIPMRKGYNCSKQDKVNSLDWYMEQEYFNEERLNKIVEWQKYAYEKWRGEEFGELILITDLLED